MYDQPLKQKYLFKRIQILVIQLKLFNNYDFLTMFS